MIRAYHSIGDWSRSSCSPASARPVTRPNRAEARAGQPVGNWRYRTLRRSRGIVVFSILFSAGLHAIALLGFNQRPPMVKPVRVADEPVIQMIMPDLKEEEIDPVEALGDEAPPESPAVAVPMLADLPTLVPVDAFVQPLDFAPVLPPSLDAVRLSAIPVNPARNSGAAQRLGKIFDVSQLDRQPEPVFRAPPVFPPELKKDYPEANVRLEFIITNKGDVVGVQVLAAENTRFGEAAVRAVEKWSFRPGVKSGRRVNTRTQITINFRVTADK